MNLHQGDKNSNMTTGNKVGKLIDALDNGFILFKDHQKDPKMVEFTKLEFIFKSVNYYEIKGWGTAFGDYKDRLLDIVQNPDDWKVFPNFNMNQDEYPYPWSTKWQEK